MRRTLLTLTLALACAQVLGDDKARQQQEEARLRALEQDIKALRDNLDRRGGERNDLAAELKQHELAVSAINHKIAALDASIARLNDELVALDHRKAALVEQRRAQQALIAREVEAAFRLGRAEPLKLLLNQEQPDHLTRTLRYYQYFVAARSAKIDGYKATLRELAEVESAIATRQDALATDRGQLDIEKADLAARSEERRRVLAALDRELGSE